MPIRCTISKAGVVNEYGQVLAIGTVYTPINDDYALALISQGRATDTDSSLVDPGVGEGMPQNTVFVNAATIASPTAQMLRDYNTDYALDVAPFERFRTNGAVMTSTSPVLSGSVLIAGFGDSITAQNSFLSSTLSYLYSNGYMTWASILSGGKLTFTNALNYGVAGDTTTMMVARLSTALAAIYASGAKYCVVHAGTNDIYSSVSYSQTIANLAAIYSGFLGLNIVPVIVPILPRAKDAASGSMLTADRQKLQRINNWIREYARSTPNVVIADPTLNIVDQAVTNGDPIGALLANSTAYTYDGLHPANRGAYWMGKAIADALQYRLSGISQALWSQIDTYDATNNPSGNLLANGYMTGTGGTNGTGSSGSVATSWTARRLVGTTGALVCSKTTVTAANGTTYPQQTIAFTAAAGSATEELQCFQQIFPGASTYAVGDTVYAECDVSVSGITAASFRSIYLRCLDDGVDARIGQPSGAGYMPDSNWSGTMRSPAFVIKPGTTAITVSMHVQIDGTVASAGVTVNFSRVALRKVGT